MNQDTCRFPSLSLQFFSSDSVSPHRFFFSGSCRVVLPEGEARPTDQSRPSTPSSGTVWHTDSSASVSCLLELTWELISCFHLQIIYMIMKTSQQRKVRTIRFIWSLSASVQQGGCSRLPACVDWSELESILESVLSRRAGAAPTNKLSGSPSPTRLSEDGEDGEQRPVDHHWSMMNRSVTSADVSLSQFGLNL